MSIHDRKDGDWFVCDGPHGYQHRILEAGSAFDRTVCDVKLSEDASLIAIAPAMFKALCELIEKADTSDDLCYGTLATTFVREIALNAIAGHCPSPPSQDQTP